jgi:NAD(P)-dependent dehydrogenase (short-subunit alcohol dehydrogenase family)
VDRPVSGRVVVVTGASAGVGRAIAREFAARGDDVALLARGSDGLKAAHDEVETAGRRGFLAEVDVSDSEAVDAAAEEIERTLGPIDVWVNNAMVSVLAPVRETTAAELRRVTDVTYLGAVHGTQAALRRMLPRDAGVIVQVGSTLSHRAIPLQAAYCASKHALRGFTDALRCELRHDGSGVRVTMVQLPGLNTPQFGWMRTRLPCHPRPVPPVYEPEMAARAIAWAADHPRREVFVGDRTGLGVWASRLAPGLVDRYLASTSIEAQQLPEPIAPDRLDNLWHPVAGDHGARGRFAAEAHDSSAQLWMTQHRTSLVTAAAALAVAVAATALRRRRRH